jgi:hypothetical protein
MQALPLGLVYNGFWSTSNKVVEDGVEDEAFRRKARRAR